MKSPGSCNPITKVVATVAPAMEASRVPRFLLTDLLIRSPEMNPKGIISNEVKKNDMAFGRTNNSS